MHFSATVGTIKTKHWCFIEEVLQHQRHRNEVFGLQHQRITRQSSWDFWSENWKKCRMCSLVTNLVTCTSLFFRRESLLQTMLFTSVRAVAVRFEVVQLQEGGIEVIILCKAWKKNSPSFFSYQDELLWHLRVLKIRKHCFPPLWSHRSLALSIVAMWLPTGLLGTPPNSWILAEVWYVVALKSGRVETQPTQNPTGDYGPLS